MSTSHTTIEIQEALKALKLYKGDIDGAIGPVSSEAIGKFQEAKNLPVTGIPDPETLKLLFPGPASTGPRSIQVTMQDWMLNLVLSKTNWAAAAMVGVLVTFLNTKFGLNIDAKAQTALTVLIASGFATLIGVLQTRFNSPHVTTKQPAVVAKPAEFQ
jgi:peptidoglycan hydrolase-like protein with peptidoglycan-binding domain